ncbi:MAG: molybdenum cofactor guanylyltransferase [Lachnospiraceae bacterium]|nr:molybdenum cofactor guanylyltransferase [Lachnospiraceae bacterium]
MQEIGAEYSMIVLAGGRSSRMGRDKSDLIYRERTFLDIQIEKGRRLGIGDILASGYRGADCAGRLVMDRFAERGPLGGLEACLRQAVHSRCLVLSVDTPLLSVTELQRLLEMDGRNSFPATILKHGDRLEPLMGVYSVALADAMAEALEEGRGSVLALLKNYGYGVYRSNAEEAQFQNINEMSEYQELLQKDDHSHLENQ